MCPHDTVCTAIYACSGVKAEGGNDGDAQGLEKHNQFLWAKKMGQQNEPRWGLFKQVAYYYICVRILCVCIPLYMCPHTIIEQNEPRWGLFKQVAYYCMCPHPALCFSAYYYMCPHPAIYVSSYY
jgi:hypothetical protein